MNVNVKKYLLFGVLTVSLLMLWGLKNKPEILQAAVPTRGLLNDSTTRSSQMDYTSYRRVYLKKKKINGKIVLSQSVLNKENSIYVVRYHYDLCGDTITIPNNCVLEFVGGSLKNGTLIGQNTVIYNTDNSNIFKEIAFAGNYLQSYICSDWFEYDNLCYLFDAIQILATSSILTLVEVNKITTTYTPLVRGYYRGEKTGYLFKIPSNTVVDFNGSVLTLAPNDISFFYALYIQDVSNVEVKNLTLIGDIEGHISTQFNEYLHGVYIYASQDIKIDNIISTKFWGDGMSITGYSDASKKHNTNLSVCNSRFTNNRRQGCSITKGENVLFENCEFIETGKIKGTPPSAGVDIEPNNGDDVIKNIVFDNCKFSYNEGVYGGVLIMTEKLKEDLAAEEIRLVNCEIDGIHQYGKGGGYIKSCIIKNTQNRITCLNASKNQIVEDCIIEFKKDNLKTRKLINLRYTNNRFNAR